MMDRKTESDKILAWFDEGNSELEDDIDNLMQMWDCKFVLVECLENELDSDDEQLSLCTPEAKYHAFENSAIKEKIGRS